MNVFLEYLTQNWPLIMVLVAFAIALRVTVFLDKHTIIRLYVLMLVVFALSITTYTEFHLSEINQYREARIVMMAIRYSATPIILSLILFTLVKRARWYVLIPAGLLAIINIISIWTGIVFTLDEAGNLVRGALGYLPYIGVGVYSFFLVFILIRQSNKQAAEIIPIAFMAVSFATGLIFPFLMGKDYSKIFATTIAVALFVYYVFLIIQITKKDPLTGLLNRQAYFASARANVKDITGLIIIDMNGLKAINDNEGHLAGDDAIATLALCFSSSTGLRQMAYRMGGDEFAILCRKTSQEELEAIVSKIQNKVGQTKYSCSIGYCYDPAPNKNFEDMAKKADEMMYKNKAEYYKRTGKDRRQV